MRVLMTAPYYYPAVRFGGPVHAMTGLVRGLGLAGCQVRVLTTTADVDGHLSVRSAEWQTVDGVSTWYEPASGYPGQSPGSYAYSSGFRQRFGEFAADADVLVSNGLFTYPALVTAQESHRLRKPYVIVPHGSLGQWSLRHKWWKKVLYWKLLERRNVNKCSAVIYTADRERDEAATLHLQAPTAIVPNCVSLDTPLERDIVAWRRRLNIIDSGQLIVFCGRLHPVKGLDLLLAAVAQLSTKLPTVHLAIIGSGEPSITEKYLALAQRLGISSLVTFAGQIEGQEKAALFAAADVFCLPSHHENFGMVVAEAMLASTPVVVSTAVAISSDVVHAACGLATELNPEAIADGLLRILESPKDARQCMGERGRKLAERDYSCRAVGIRMREVLETLITAQASAVELLAR